MTAILLEGFDKYGAVNSNQASVGTLLAQEWTTATSTGCTIVPGLSSPGTALQVTGNTAGITKTLPASYSRLVGGVRFSCSVLASNPVAIQFLDGASQQAGIAINSTGTFSVKNGNAISGTILGTSSTSVTTSSIHYLEWDITFANSGSYQLWLDGVSILSGSGDTTATANSTANGLQLTQGTGPTVTWDDLYLFETTTSPNNAVLLTSPRIETTFPASDNSVQFSFGAATLGSSVARNSTNYATVANTLYLRPYTPSRACTLNSIGLLPAATSATINLRPVVYADNGGTPNGGLLMSSGSTVTGMTSGTLITMALTSSQSLSAGTQYWLGFMNDIAVTNGIAGADALTAGRSATSTFTSGAPGTCPTMTTGIATAVAFGGITLSSPVNFYEVGTMPPQGLQSYVTDTTVGHEDLFNFGALSFTPATIYAVAVKANCSRSDSGARTVSMRVKSSATDDGGSATGQTPGTSFGWLTSYWATDPNGSIAWTGPNLDAAQSGFKVDA